MGLVLPALDKAVKAVGRGFLDLLGDLRDTIGGNGLDPLHRDQRTVRDVVVGLGDDLFLGRGFVGQGLGDGLGAGGNAIDHGIRCRCNGLGHGGSNLFIGLLGLGRGLAVVGDILGDSLVVFHHAVHHLLAGFGHGAGQPVILLAALAQVLGEVGGLDGHLAQGVGGVGVACVLQGPQQGLGGLCGGLGLFGRLGGGVPGLGIGRDDHLRHGLGAVGHVGVGVRPDGGPVVPAGGFSNGGTGGGCDGSCTNRTAFAGEAVDKALDKVLAPLHRLRGQALDPGKRTGKAALEGVQQAGAHALHAIGHTGEDGLADVQPVDGRDDRQHRLQDLFPVGQQTGHGLYKTGDQLHDDGHALRQDLGHVIVDDPADVDDDVGHIGDQVRQACDQAVQQLGDEVQAGVHEHTGVGPQFLGELQQLRQGIGQKIRDALGEALRQRGDQLGAGLQNLGHQCIHQLRDARQHVADHGQQVAHKEGLGRFHQPLQGGGEIGTGGPVGQHVLGGSFHGRKAAGQGGGCLLGRGAGDVHLLLDDVDGAVHVG